MTWRERKKKHMISLNTLLENHKLATTVQFVTTTSKTVIKMGCQIHATLVLIRCCQIQLVHYGSLIMWKKMLLYSILPQIFHWMFKNFVWYASHLQISSTQYITTCIVWQKHMQIPFKIKKRDRDREKERKRREACVFIWLKLIEPFTYDL